MDLLDTLNQNYHSSSIPEDLRDIVFKICFSANKNRPVRMQTDQPVLYLSDIFFDFFSLCHSTTEASEPLLFCHGSSDHALHLMPACLQKVLYSLP